MVRYVVLIALLLTLASTNALVSSNGAPASNPNSHALKTATLSEKAQKEIDLKFVSYGLPAISTFGTGITAITGFAQRNFLPFVDDSFSEFGGGFTLARWQWRLQRLITRFQLLIQYIQSIQCFSCGVSQYQIAAFNQIAIRLILRIQSLLYKISIYYGPYIGQITPFVAPLATLLPTFFQLCQPFGLTGAIQSASGFSTTVWSRFGIGFGGLFRS